ncbi:MAG: tetratricopeptide repeat protein [Desulfitobacteriaceae bacterium]|nr:tetratricopeptide repeat protein [Desulfitobacteriaceae bacterium]MDI6912821.1 tetratricopeptide repeat protein [Desulfitobacteriaceae bacterium]
MSHPLASNTRNRLSKPPIFWRQLLALGHLLVGQNDEAIGIWVELLKLDSPKPRLDIVRRLIKAKVFAEVKEYLEICVQKNVEDRAEIKYWLAQTYLGLGLIQEAKELLEQAIAFGPEKAEYWDRLTDCLLEQGEWQLAVEALDKSLKVNPKRGDTVFRLGIIYAYHDEYAEALRCFSGACQLRPRNPQYWEMKAEMHLWLEQIEEASRAFSRALWYSADPETMARAAYCQVQLNHIEKGIRYYERVLKHEPDHYDSLSNLAAIYQNKNRSNEALHLLERAQAIHPHDPILLNNLAYTLVHLGRTRRALEYYQAALNLAPSHPLILYNMSVCLAGKGEWDHAIGAIQNLLEVNPEHSDAWALLGNVYDELNEPELAIDCFNRALKLA